MKTPAKHRQLLTTDGRPFGCYLSEQVRWAVARAPAGEHRDAAERWLEGTRRFDWMIAPAQESKS